MDAARERGAEGNLDAAAMSSLRPGVNSLSFIARTARVSSSTSQSCMESQPRSVAATGDFCPGLHGEGICNLPSTSDSPSWEDKGAGEEGAPPETGIEVCWGERLAAANLASRGPDSKMLEPNWLILPLAVGGAGAERAALADKEELFRCGTPESLCGSA